MAAIIRPEHLPVLSMLRKLANAGGFTFNPRTGTFVDSTDGEAYGIGGVPGNRAVVLPLAELRPETVRKAFRDNAEPLAAPCRYFGGWVDKAAGVVYLETSELWHNRAEAERIGRERGELALWDFANGRELRLDGADVAA